MVLGGGCFTEVGPVGGLYARVAVQQLVLGTLIWIGEKLHIQT